MAKSIGIGIFLIGAFWISTIVLADRPIQRDPMTQSVRQEDIDVTAAIRRRIIDDNRMSTYAKNIKIITKDGAVSLSGEAQTALEKRRIEDLAKEIAGAKNVDSRLVVSADGTVTSIP